MSVSCVCSLETRKKLLAPAFAELLVDTSQWVRMTAYRVLGAFICTFAEPSITGLEYGQHGDLVFVSHSGYEFGYFSFLNFFLSVLLSLSLLV